MSAKQIKLIINEEERKIGKIDPTGRVFITWRKPNHYFRKYNGFGINLELLNKLKLNNVKAILIKYKGTKLRRYYIGVKGALKYGVKYKHKDFEEQVIINLIYWSELEWQKDSKQVH